MKKYTASEILDDICLVRNELIARLSPKKRILKQMKWTFHWHTTTRPYFFNLEKKEGKKKKKYSTELNVQEETKLTI